MGLHFGSLFRSISGPLVEGERRADAQLEGSDGAQGAVVAAHPRAARAGQPEGLRKLLLHRRELTRKLQVSSLIGNLLSNVEAIRHCNVCIGAWSAWIMELASTKLSARALACLKQVI